MRTETQIELLSMVDELHREAATALGWKAHTEKHFPWRQHDARIYAERAQAALQAAAHLIQEMGV